MPQFLDRGLRWQYFYSGFESFLEHGRGKYIHIDSNGEAEW